MNDVEMNEGTPESAFSSETLFAGEKDYAANRHALPAP